MSDRDEWVVDVLSTELENGKTDMAEGKDPSRRAARPSGIEESQRYAKSVWDEETPGGSWEADWSTEPVAPLSFL